MDHKQDVACVLTMKRSLRILHISQLAFPTLGGVQIAVHSLIRAQIQAGHDARLLTAHKNWRLRPSGLGYICYPFLPRSLQIAQYLDSFGDLGRRFIALQLSTLWHRWNFDVVHVHLAYPIGYFSSYFAKNFSGPSVVTCHGIDVQCVEQFGYGYRLKASDIERHLFDGFMSYKAVTVVGQSMLADIAEIGYSKRNVWVVPNGADYKRIAGNSGKRKHTREQWGIPPNTKLLLCLGRNHPKKGFKLFPKIAAHLLDKHKDFCFLLVGHGNEEIVREAEELGYGNYVKNASPEKTGSVVGDGGVVQLPSDGVVDLLCAADAFVFPTLLEGMPLVLVEAMSAGLPIFTTDAPGCIGIARHQETAFVSPAGDAKGMAQNLCLLWEAPTTVYAIADRAQSEARDKYSWAAIAGRYETIYSGLFLQGVSS